GEVAKRLLAGVKFEPGASLAHLARAGEASTGARSWLKKEVLAGIAAGFAVVLLSGLGMWVFRTGTARQPGDPHDPVQASVSGQAASTVTKVSGNLLPPSSKWTGEVL